MGGKSIGERRVGGRKKVPGLDRFALGTMDKGLTGINSQHVHEVRSMGVRCLRIYLIQGRWSRKSVFIITHVYPQPAAKQRTEEE